MEPTYDQVKEAVRVTLSFVLIAVPLELILGFLLAVLFNQHIFGRPVLRTMMILPIFATPLAVGYSFFTIFYEVGGPLSWTHIPFLSNPTGALFSVLLVANVVHGVSSGFERNLEIQGVGYRVQLQGTALVLQVGYSHPVEFPAPEGITFEVPAPTRIVVKGASKAEVGQTAANIRKIRPPEPYKGKGIRYEGERVRRKVGKAAK